MNDAHHCDNNRLSQFLYYPLLKPPPTMLLTSTIRDASGPQFQLCCHAAPLQRILRHNCVRACASIELHRFSPRSSFFDSAVPLSLHHQQAEAALLAAQLAAFFALHDPANIGRAADLAQDSLGREDRLNR